VEGSVISIDGDSVDQLAEEERDETLASSSKRESKERLAKIRPIRLAERRDVAHARHPLCLIDALCLLFFLILVIVGVIVGVIGIFVRGQ
jgi:hypothetical protein